MTHRASPEEWTIAQSDIDGETREADARPTPIRWIAGVVGVVAVGLIATIALAGPSAQNKPSPVVGEVVPQLRGTTLSGEDFDIDQHRGQWVVVNLFATWCVPCQVEHPELVAFDEAHSAAGDAQLVSVVFGDEDDAVREFFSERGGTWPVLGEEYSSIVIDFGARGVPETFVVAPNGVVVQQMLGGVTKDVLDGVIERGG